MCTFCRWDTWTDNRNRIYQVSKYTPSHAEYLSP
ncbi:hypothetical protein CJF30_00011368 [Rutstroemia sp. NJR-2017a BBW]|nr:hypothetical protein CJF30_00011368 [Rutstroemia sp. NJR-2017a BBW]